MTPLDIPPGVIHEESRVRNGSNWRETHLIRWEGNTILPIQGWEYSTLASFASPCRAIYRWVTNDRLRCTAYLCERHCYVDTGGTLIDISPTPPLASPGGNVAGYGDLDYNESSYGTPRAGPSKLANFTPAYTLGNWGDELRAMTSPDGRYLKWVPSTPTTALVTVPGSPTGRTFVITPERHAMIFGLAGKFDSFGWSDQENDGDWNFASTLNKAGSYDLEPSSPIIARQQFFGGVLVFTMQAAYLVRNIGLPYVYNYTEIGKPSVPINAQCVTEGPDGVIWASIDGFWLYDGNSIRPIPCPLWDYIKKYIDFQSSMFSAAVVNVPNKDELWWFYADNRDNSATNTRVIILEYRRGWWSMGKLARTCGYTFSNDRYPLMSNGLQVLKHEVGYDYPGEEYPWAESFSMNLSEGANWATVHQMLPEIMGDERSIQFRLLKKTNRTRQDDEVLGPPRKPFNGNGLVDFRETARDFRLRIEMVDSNFWSIGPILVDAKERGRK